MQTSGKEKLLDWVDGSRGPGNPLPQPAPSYV